MMDPAISIAFFVMYSVVHVFGQAQPNNSYFITAPSVFRPGRPLKLHVMLSDAVTSPVDIVATIADHNHFPVPRDDQVVARGSGTFTNGPAAELTLQIPHGVAVPSASYVLHILGTGGLDINQTKYIGFREKGLSIYIQTDKAIYKPGQKILMRIFGVHPDLKVYTGNVTVDILDPDKNKMAHWVDLNSKSGVIKREFLLSTDPVEGNWKISVTSEDQSAEQVIEVKPYVLPKFEVKVNLPPYVLEKDRKVHGTVDVKYTYGKGVKGRANVKAFFNTYWWKDKITALSKDISVDASDKGLFSFNVKDILQLYKQSFPYIRDANLLFQYGSRMDVNVTFHEDITGKIATAQGSVSFHQVDVKLKFAEFNPSYYKPGLPYQALLQVLQPNGEQLSLEKLRMMRSKIKVTTEYNGRSHGEVEFVSPELDGTVIITRNVPKSADTLYLRVEYSELFGNPVSAGLYASKSFSPSDSYIQLSTSTPSIKAGDNIACEVQATYTLSELNYMILARGIAVKTDTYTPVSGSTKLSFSIPSTPAMAPTCRLVVYSMKQGGEIVVDTLNIKVENPFQNEVSLTVDTNSRSSVNPGDMVTFKAKASADSLVAFRAVDKSVLLMKEDTDISVMKVLEELQSYDSASQWYPFWHGGFGRGRRLIMPYPTSGRDANSIFSNSGVLVFTNYNLPSRWNILLRKSFAAVDGDVMVPESAPDSAGGVAPTLAEVKRVRTLFPETWIWMERNASASGDVEFQQAVPDTLTTWVASAFAVSPSDGLGVGEVKPLVQVFQSFFVSMNLPYSVVRGEEVALQVTVFNYEEKAQLVKITLKGSKNWAVIDETNALGLRGKSEKFPSQPYVESDVDQAIEVSVGAGQGRAVSFPVVPQTLGQVPIEVRAQSASNADAVRRNLLVEPEGIQQEYSFSLLLNFSSSSSVSHELLLDLPDDTVTGSARATVSVMGDILGSSISNLDHLVRMPYGCGEQNMVNFAPNIYVMKYLTAVNQLSQGIENKAKTYMISGYQREQRYRHNDGSYSAFGGRDTSGSMWLTAFVAKSFAQARSFIPEYIDNELLETSLQWMARQANRDGSFPKVGRVSSYLKGGQDGEVSLTAYVLIALAEANSQATDVVNAMNKAKEFLENEAERMTKQNTDSYTLAITTYALSLVNSPKRFNALSELEALAVKRDGLTYWKEKKETDGGSPWERPYYRPRSADIEITAYALMALTSARDLNDLLPIGRWLSQQRSSLGGYSSTQDTVIGLQALSEFAAGIYSSDIDFSVQLTSSVDPSFAKTIAVDQQTAMVLQQVEILKVGGSLFITGSGRGVGMLQVGVTYNVEKEPGERSFGFDLEVEEETDYMVKLKACSKWAENEGKSGMVVMDLGIPSGFELDPDSVEDSLSNPSLQLKRVETADRKVLLYFDEIPSDHRVCVSVMFLRAYNVGKPQPSTAVIYDYYKPENRATSLYVVGSLRDKGVCSLCADCVNCAPGEPTELPASLAPGHCATLGSAGLALLLLAVLLQ